MGRNKKRKHSIKAHHDRRRKQDRGEGDGVRFDYVATPKENKIFEQYYKGASIVEPSEWDEFMNTLRQPLPATFRITGFKSHAREMLAIIKSDYLNEATDLDLDGRKVKPAKCLSWYPEELAWQLDLERKLIRQNRTLGKLHQFLVQETESGNISRQESVSMIPPLVLDVKPDSKVLDMCAAPGSKTAQLIEMLHSNEAVSAPEGYVIANDSDNNRCYLMVHQMRRLVSPNFAVTNMDASNLPSLVSAPPEAPGKREVIKFDRILCDVPCSGDGTLRKNVDLWARWNPAIAYGLHGLQLRILRRGVDLLEVGGRLVYSTCSFNPVENEAVVAAILKQTNGSLVLVDVSNDLPGLVRQPGMFSWRVMSKQGEWFETYDEVPERLRSQITVTSFPPSHADAQTLKLDRCLRVLPHKQNTGGFFVAVFEKHAPISKVPQANKSGSPDATQPSLVPESTDPVVDCYAAPPELLPVEEVDQRTECCSNQVGLKRRADTADDNEPQLKRNRHYGFREDPFIFLKQDDDMWTPVQRFFGIADEFPFSQLMVRCDTGKKRNIYFVSSIIKKLVQDNEDKLKFINLGVKMFSRSVSKSVDCDFRLVQDGLHILYPYITKRVVHLSKQDVITLLSSENPYVNRMSKPTQDQLTPLDQGGCVFVSEPDSSCTSTDGLQCRLLLCGWKGKISCRSFLPKYERGHYLRLCGVELTDTMRKSEKTTLDGSLPSIDHLDGSPHSGDALEGASVSSVSATRTANDDEVELHDDVVTHSDDYTG